MSIAAALSFAGGWAGAEEEGVVAQPDAASAIAKATEPNSALRMRSEGRAAAMDIDELLGE